MKYTATRSRAYRSHCHSALIVPIRYARCCLAVRNALPLAPERAIPHVHHRVAVYGAPPSTLTAEWQCESHCPARSPPSGSVRRTATRPRAYRSHCHSALIVPIRYARCCLAVRNALPLAPERAIPHVHHRVAVYGAPPSTLTTEWQCETHCHSPPSVPDALPLGPERTDTARSMPSGSEERTATRP